MTDLRKAAENILKVLDGEPELLTAWLGRLKEAREALRQALAQTEQEPVFGMFEEKMPDQNPPLWVRDYNACLPTSIVGKAIRHAPPKREWVGLTDGDLPDNAPYEFTAVVRWAEAKLKEKNT